MALPVQVRAFVEVSVFMFFFPDTWNPDPTVSIIQASLMNLARIFHESLAATTDMAVLPGVLGCRPLRRTVQVRLGTNPAVPRDELPGGTPIFVISRQQFIKYPGYPIYRKFLLKMLDKVVEVPVVFKN